MATISEKNAQTLIQEHLRERDYAEYPAFARRSVRARSPAPAEQGPRRRSRR